MYVPVNIPKDLFEHGCLIQYNNLVTIPMRTGVDDPIHIKIKIIDDSVTTQSFIETPINIGILVREPTEHLRDTKEFCGSCSWADMICFRKGHIGDSFILGTSIIHLLCTKSIGIDLKCS